MATKNRIILSCGWRNFENNIRDKGFEKLIKSYKNAKIKIETNGIKQDLNQSGFVKKLDRILKSTKILNSSH